jgi:hypothetical protein
MRVLRSYRYRAALLARWNTIDITVVNAVVIMVCEDDPVLEKGDA